MTRGFKWVATVLLAVVAVLSALCVQWSSYARQRGLVEDRSISAIAARHPEMKAAFDAVAACEERRKHGADRPPITTAFCISTVRERAVAMEKPDVVEAIDELTHEIGRETKAIEVPFPPRILL